MATPLLPGAEAWSHCPPGSVTGVVVVHGFTGNPSSVRELAEAFAAAGHHVELPRLPGHGTTVDDMATTGWSDWAGEVDAAYRRLTERVGTVVLAGQSMGAALALHTALAHPEVAGLVCVNPATVPAGDDVLEMIDELLDEGITIVPGGSGDIADPDVVDNSYVDTPLAAARSFYRDGLVPMFGRYGELTMPMRLFTSRQDHVLTAADHEHLLATYGGPIEHTWLERSYHVATQDLDRRLVFDESAAFVERSVVA